MSKSASPAVSDLHALATAGHYLSDCHDLPSGEVDGVRHPGYRGRGCGARSAVLTAHRAPAPTPTGGEGGVALRRARAGRKQVLDRERKRETMDSEAVTSRCALQVGPFDWNSRTDVGVWRWMDGGTGMEWMEWAKWDCRCRAGARRLLVLAQLHDKGLFGRMASQARYRGAQFPLIGANKAIVWQRAPPSPAAIPESHPPSINLHPSNKTPRQSNRQIHTFAAVGVCDRADSHSPRLAANSRTSLLFFFSGLGKIVEVCGEEDGGGWGWMGMDHHGWHDSRPRS